MSDTQTKTNPLKTVNDYIDANLVHSIHVSERRSFRGCRRRWDWVYRGLWYPSTTPKPLEFGIAYHKALEHWYDPDFWGKQDPSTRQIETLQTFKVECERQLNEYRAKVRSGLIQEFSTPEEVEADYKERVLLGQGMLKQMFRMSAELDHDQWRPVGVEVKFEVPIPNPATARKGDYHWPKVLKDEELLWCKCERCWKRYLAYYEAHAGEFDEPPPSYQRWKGLPVTLGGRIDMLAEDTSGRFWPFDWKTAARLSTGEPNAPDDFLWFDDQITSYCWALWLLGVDVAGFVYHEQKKAVPEEPEPLVRPRLNRMYSTNKQTDYDYETYLRTVEENDPHAYQAGLYDEFLDYLKENSGKLYKRHEITRTHDELLRAGYYLSLEAEEMTSPSLRVYPSAGRFTCNGCAFREPCLAKNRGEDYRYTLQTLFEKRTKLYYETEPLNTDKKASA